MGTSMESTYSQLPDFLKKAIDAELKVAVEEEIAAVHKRIDERLAQIVAGVILRAGHMLDVQTMTDRISITVKLEQ